MHVIWIQADYGTRRDEKTGRGREKRRQRAARDGDGLGFVVLECGMRVSFVVQEGERCRCIPPSIAHKYFSRLHLSPSHSVG